MNSWTDEAKKKRVVDQYQPGISSSFTIWSRKKNFTNLISHPDIFRYIAKYSSIIIKIELGPIESNTNGLHTIDPV